MQDRHCVDRSAQWVRWALRQHAWGSPAAVVVLILDMVAHNVSRVDRKFLPVSLRAGRTTTTGG